MAKRTNKKTFTKSHANAFSSSLLLASHVNYLFSLSCFASSSSSYFHIFLMFYFSFCSSFHVCLFNALDFLFAMILAEKIYIKILDY